MVLTAAQRTAFFENPDQLGIPHDTFLHLVNDGIENENDLVDFDEASIKQIAENLRRPPGGGPALQFGAKSQARLTTACDLMRYYQATGRDPTAGNLQWTRVMRNFQIQWKALQDRKKDGEEPDVPKITRSLPIMKWTEAFPDFLRQVIGVRTIPLIYVIRTDENVPAAAPALATHQPHSEMHGSVEGELIARASHNHPLFRNDNGQVYHYLEEATRTTVYAASLKPFQRARDGRAAWLALVAQYAGVDKWEAELKRQEDIMHTRKWKGQNNFPLEGFVSQHRSAYVSMQACATHVQYQLPTQHSRVGYLLNAIENGDAGLQAAMASVRTDNGPGGARNDFEQAVSAILPYDPVAKRKSSGNNKRNSALISDLQVGDEINISGVAGKQGIGKTGVHFRWYKGKEYSQLTKEQRTELNQWRSTLPDGDPRKPRNKGDKNKRPKTEKLSSKNISALVSQELQKLVKADKQEQEEKHAASASISALVKAEIAKIAASDEKPADVPQAPRVSLKSILKQARNATKN